jgi:hypothetical protein
MFLFIILPPRQVHRELNVSRFFRALACRHRDHRPMDGQIHVFVQELLGMRFILTFLRMTDLGDSLLVYQGETR